MPKEFPGSTQKDLRERGSSLGAKYRRLFVGRPGLWPLLKYELVSLFVAPAPGALGFALRRAFFPALLGETGRRVVFGRNITLRHPHKIRIGDGCVIDDGAVLDAKGEGNLGIAIGAGAMIGRGTILTCKEGSIEIGDDANLSAGCHLLSESHIAVGRSTFLAGGCYLVAGGNHPVTDPSRPIMDQPSLSKGGISVGEDCWLGAGVIVLDGVRIGRGTIVGAGAVVAASLPDYTLAVPNRRLNLQDRRELASG